ncbi:MAG: CHAT domain-containing protein [Lewinellaceae bacterium]|nr:CHAT domain-containing protein [Lewinellaceae bacterium]
MPPKRPILLFAFANDEAYRLRLEAEERALREALAEADRRKEIEYKPIGQASLDDIYNTFNKLNDQIYLFHYGGHSDSEFLHLSGGHARSESLATLMGQQKYLKLVFLNGCSNREQVEALFDKGVPAVIATHAPVGDEDARHLAEQFYKALAGGKTIKQAFESAASYVQNKKPELDIRYRGVNFDEIEVDGFPWGLYAQKEVSLDWHFDLVEQESNLEILARLREASRKRYRAFTDTGGRYQYLRIDEALLAGIENTREGEARKLINTRIGEDKTPLEQSLEVLWANECSHALLVGVGGMGKTVSLIQLWAHYLDAERAGWPAPIFIPLNEFNNRPEKGFIRNYIREHYGGEDIDRLLKEPLQAGEARYPHLILLLDGFNEVTATSNELILEINELGAPDKYPGVQLVLSSRVDMRQAYQWQRFHLLELQPLSDEQVESFLQQSLPTDSRLLELLRNPMMLSIYAAQTELPMRYREKGLLKEDVTSTGEMLFNVEMLQRIKIEELHFSDLRKQAFHRFILEHLLPAIGWQMQQAELFFLEKKSRQAGQLGMEEALSQAIAKYLNDDFHDAFPFFSEYLEEERFEGKSRKLFHSIIDQICCRKLALLVAEEGNYRFLHQNFRDYFAARYVQNQIRIALQRSTFPEVLKKAPLDFYVRQLLGELEEEHSNRIEWIEEEKRWKWSRGQFFIDNHLSQLLEFCRGVFDIEEVGYTVWNLLTIWKEQRGELSGADLHRLNFQRVCINGLRICRPGLPTCLSEGLIGEENLFPQGHSDGIYRAIYSPEGKRILTTSHDSTLKIWDIKSGQCISTLDGQWDHFNSETFSPDGQLVLSTSDHNIRIWDAKSGRCKQVINGHNKDISKAIFSPDGKQVLSISEGRNGKIWDVQTGNRILTLKGHSKTITNAVYSPDGLHILTASDDKTAKVWDAKSGRCLKTLKGHSDKLRSATYSLKGRQILTASWDKTAKVWDANDGQELMTLQGHSNIVQTVANSPDDRLILTMSNDRYAKVYDAKDGKCLLTLGDNQNEVWSAIFSPNGKQVLTVLGNHCAKCWDTKSGQCLLTLGGHSSPIFKAAYSPSGQEILAVVDHRKVEIYEAESGQRISTLLSNSNRINSIVYSPNGQQILTASSDETAKIWDAQKGKCLIILDDHLGSVNSAVYNSNGTQVLTTSEVTAKIWNAQTGQCLKSLEGHTDLVFGAIFNPNGEKALTASRDKSIRTWDARNGKQLLILGGYSSPIDGASFSPDGARILSVSSTLWTLNRDPLTTSPYVTKVWDAHSGKCLLTLEGHRTEIQSAVFSPNGKHILTCSGDQTGYPYHIAKVWDAQTGQCLMTLDGNMEGKIFRFRRAEYSSDGQHILTYSSDVYGPKNKTANVWDAQTGQCLLTIVGDPNNIRSSNFSPDGQEILTLIGYQNVKTWDAQNGQCLLNIEGDPLEFSCTTYSPDGQQILTVSNHHTTKTWNTKNSECKVIFQNIYGLFIQGCEFRNLNPDSHLSEESIALLKQYGGIFDDEDANEWKKLMEKHLGIQKEE